MPKPICVTCERFMRIVKNGYHIIEGRPVKPGAKPGPHSDLDWTPYKIWRGDLWACPKCLRGGVYGFGLAPVAESHSPDFEARLIEAVQALNRGDGIRVNDC